MKLAYCDCFSGISGDMFLAAMIDAGLPEEYLLDQLLLLHLPEKINVYTEPCHKGALLARELFIEIDTAYDGEASYHQGEHRHYNDIMRLINVSELNSQVKVMAEKIFTNLATAEAKVRGTKIEEVHFHEVGALDSIIDIVGAAIALDYFKIDQLYSSALPLTAGSVMTQHGLLPLPVPATTELLTNAKAPVRTCQTEEELVTPTGAAILTTFAEFSQPDMTLQKIGIGAGKKNLPWANICRILIGENEQGNRNRMIQIETNIDDMNPELYQSVMEQLFEAGAMDVYYTPIFMKKNRPAVTLGVIGREDAEKKLTDIILQHTSTFGVRVQPLMRHEANRKIVNVHTPIGDIPVKLKIIDHIVIQASPEYRVCQEVSKAQHCPLQIVYQHAIAASLPLIGKNEDSVTSNEERKV